MEFLWEVSTAPYDAVVAKITLLPVQTAPNVKCVIC